ncbi:hypothetical protein SAMN04487898_105128 [Pedobacter sp. ok626]|uniref:hypothetical protein n=1 Tax=Pedobacter sp. ok626 TaxID=1761882 RepID=UPI00088044AA|nr:hypothetical protein [Pedobacter sp. ok626]SDJ94900.1 hypothetical protein SAMN04487898_105128 [Pedobacter sp. ok626]
MSNYDNYQKIIPIYLETIEAFPYDDMVNDYFKFLEKLVKKGYTLTIHREMGTKKQEVLQTISDVQHVKNFIAHYKKAIGIS